MTIDVMTPPVEINEPEVVDTESNTRSVDYITYEGNTRQLKGMRIVYKDPAVRTRDTIRYGVVLSVGPRGIKVRPFNKFAKFGNNSFIKAKELGMKFIILKEEGGDNPGVMFDQELITKNYVQ